MMKCLLGCAALAALVLAGPDAHARSEQEERNLRFAWEFYDAALNEKDWEKAETYIGDVYDQHSIYMEDQAAGLKDLVDRIKAQYPENRGEVKRAFAAGDMVVIHLHVTRYPGHQGWSVIELMRLEDEKVVEHWDMFQVVPEESANDNGMF